MKDPNRNILFSIFSITLGIIFSIGLIATTEVFFQLNSRFHWLDQPPEKSFGNDDPKYLPAEIDISPFKNLTPYESVSDYSEPDNYEDTYRFKDCLEPRLQLKPYWFGAPNCNARMIMKKRRTGRVVYDVYYNYYQYGLRKIPSANTKSDAFLLFLGCSYTLGEGVDGEFTFPNQLTKKLGSFNAFNLGMVAYGPNHIDQLLNKDRSSDIRLQAIHGNKGIAIYTFLDDHIRRAISTLSWHRDYKAAAFAPYFRLENSRLVQEDLFFKSRPFRTKLFDFLGNSELLNFFRIEWPVIGEDELKLFTAIIVDIKSRLETEYKIKKFIFSFFPTNARYVKQLKPLLEKQGIEVFDFSNVDALGLMHERFFLFGNGHPSPEGYQFYSELVANEIKSRGLLSYLK